jgi:protein TonB
MAYAIEANPAERANAITAVAAVHALLAVIILSGLNVSIINRAVERIATFDVVEPPPPPPVAPPPPAPKPQAMKKPAGAPAPKAEAVPIVAPPPKLPLPTPVPAAKVAGSGSAPSSGASSSGTGTGAGGAGNGPGGGGDGDFSRFTPARQITTIPNREYRRLAAGGMESGSVGVTMKVNTDGSVSNCRIARSSGNGYADAMMCQLASYYVRFRPALDPAGRPVAQDITWFPRWWRP